MGTTYRPAPHPAGALFSNTGEGAHNCGFGSRGPTNYESHEDEGQRPGRAREPWITKRRDEAARSGDSNFSQMHFARRDRIPEEMGYVARRERLAPDLARDEVAAGA